MQTTKAAICLGIGGGAMYYIAQYLHHLGYRVQGFDISNTDRTRTLEKLGVTISYENPTLPFPSKPDLLLYSNALPDKIIEPLVSGYPDAKEVGAYYQSILDRKVNSTLQKAEETAIELANLAPLYNFDKSDLTIIGVTGTDGKTTTSHMIYSILRAAGHPTGLISTIGAYIDDQVLETGLHVTSPSAQELAELLSQMVDAGCTHIVLEITSHALVTGRIAGLPIDISVLTNISPEHLDYHQTLDNLIEAKSLLFTQHLTPTGTAIINADDQHGYAALAKIPQSKIYYSIEPDSPTRKENLMNTVMSNKITPYETSTKFDSVISTDNTNLTSPIEIPLIGDYNVSNALAAISVAVTLNISPDSIQKALQHLAPIRGRAEILQQKPFTVVVDFAHTANGLEKILTAAKILKKTPQSRLIVVFGAAGKRDPSKRIPMGEIAAKLADITVLTAEDPRTESLREINDAIEQGWQGESHSKSTLKRFDDETNNVETRRDAIDHALSIAEPGDVVVITGKAHEQSLCFGTTEYPWNDIDEVTQILNNTQPPS